MGIEPIQIFLFITLFLPGYIFIQVHDYYLLKRQKTQFEKTIQIILISTLLWICMLFIPNLPFLSIRLDSLILKLQSIESGEKVIAGLFLHYRAVISVVAFVCVYSFVIANIWSWIRKINWIELIFTKITGRDRFQMVSLRYYDENIGEQVIITTKSQKKYMGILNGAPDNEQDESVILYDPYRIDEKNLCFNKMQAESILFKIPELEYIELLKEGE